MHEREWINCDPYLEQILGKPRLRFAEIPQHLQQLLHPPDPIVLHHTISVDPADAKKQACYDIEVINCLSQHNEACSTVYRKYTIVYAG